MSNKSRTGFLGSRISSQPSDERFGSLFLYCAALAFLVLTGSVLLDAELSGAALFMVLFGALTIGVQLVAVGLTVDRSSRLRLLQSAAVSE